MTLITAWEAVWGSVWAHTHIHGVTLKSRCSNADLSTSSPSISLHLCPAYYETPMGSVSIKHVRAEGRGGGWGWCSLGTPPLNRIQVKPPALPQKKFQRLLCSAEALPGSFLSAPLGSSHRVSGIRQVGRLHKAEMILSQSLVHSCPSADLYCPGVSSYIQQDNSQF